MKTYIYQETNDAARGFNVRISVHRIIRNRPHFVSSSDFNTASWKGAHGEAVTIIHNADGLQYATDLDGPVNRYMLRNELGPCAKYTDSGHARNAVRLLSI